MNNEYQNWRDDTAKGIEWAVQKHRLSDKIAFLYRKERVFRLPETFAKRYLSGATCPVFKWLDHKKGGYEIRPYISLKVGFTKILF